MNRPSQRFAPILLGAFAALTLAVPTIGYGQENSENRERRGGWGRSDDGDRDERRDRDRDRDRRRRDRDDDDDDKPAYVAPPRSLSPQNESMGFGKPKAKVEGKGFGASKTTSGPNLSPDATVRDREWAEAAMKKYDKNGDGSVTDPELEKSRIAIYDKNDDGKVDLNELIAFSQGAPKSPTGTPLTKKSYRLLSAAEKLPKEGLPSWFNDRDRNHDAQVSMHEWSRSWNSSTVRDFTSKDADGDGIITVTEAIESAR